MNGKLRVFGSICFGAALLTAACTEDGDMMLPDDGIADGTGEADTGDGDGDDPDTGMMEDPCADYPSPYMGGWDIGCGCQDEIAQNGWSPGGVAAGTILPDWTFNDQYGDAVRIWDFCHNAIYFEYVAFW